jgi:cobalt-zinc-cadmium efflux system membrane fusion protein
MQTIHIICAVLVALCATACNGAQNAAPEEKSSKKFCLEGDFKQKIAFEKPQIKPVSLNIPLTGTVETNPDRVIHFASLVGGVVSATYFSLGDKVTKGELLAELQSSGLTDLQTELKNLESRIIVAEKKLQAAQSMYDDGITAQKDLLEAKSELEIILSEKQRITSKLSLFSASPEKGVFQIKAPASGIITEKSVSAGTQITSEGASLFTLSDLSEVWVMVNVYASNVKNIAVGMPVAIKTLAYPGEVFNGKIEAVSQVYDAEARVLKAKVVLPNADFKLKPGMLVDVIARREESTTALCIPLSATVFDDNGYFVIVYHEDCNLEIRPITPLIKSGETLFVAEGLKEGETIISKNQLLIYEQLKNFEN